MLLHSFQLTDLEQLRNWVQSQNGYHTKGVNIHATTKVIINSDEFTILIIILFDVFIATQWKVHNLLNGI